MSRYKHFTIEERESLSINLQKELSISEIARRMNRSKSSISREIKRNGGSRENYRAVSAQKQYQSRRKKCVRKKKFSDPKYVEIVTKLLKECWSPEQIANRLRLEENPVRVSTATIYRALESGLIDPRMRLVLRIKGKRRCGGRKKSKCGRMDVEYSIHDRPKSVEERKTIGHWESDTVRGAKWSGCICTHVERVSRFAVLVKIPDRTAASFAEATMRVLGKLPKYKRKSLTADHGKEFADHREIHAAINCKVYFADPYSPWQRGTNENFNGLLRQFFPKRTSFAEVTQEDVEAIAELLNRRPRKCLGWKSPLEIFFNKSLHLT